MATVFFYLATIITAFFALCFVVLFICATTILLQNEETFINRVKVSDNEDQDQ